MTPQETQPQSSDLRYYVAVLRDRIGMALLIVGLAVVGTLLLSARQTPSYEASAKVLVKAPFNPAQAPVSAGDVLALETEQEIAQSEEVARRAAEKLTPPATPEELIPSLEVDVPVDTQILEITFADASPQRARQGAQAFAEAYLEYKTERAQQALNEVKKPLNAEIEAIVAQLHDLNVEIAGNNGQASATQTVERDVLASRLAILGNQLAPLSSTLIDPGEIIQSAKVPDSASSPNHLVNGAIGLVIGMILAVVVVFIRERLDDTVRTRQELEHISGAPVLGAIPRIAGRGRRDRLAVLERSEKTGASEAYRALRASILFAASTRHRKVIMVASAEPRDGKTMTAVNLAVALAQAQKRVVLISGDLRSLALERYFTLDGKAGLTEYLTGAANLKDICSTVRVRRLRVIAAGRATSAPGEMLGSEAMTRLLASLRQEADFIIIDTPPLLSVSDALALGPLADAVLFVARAGFTTKGAVEEARAQIEQVGVELMGSVLNASRPSQSVVYPYHRAYSNGDERGKKDRDGDATLSLPSESATFRSP